MHYRSGSQLGLQRVPKMKIGRAKLVNKPTTTKGKKYDKYFVFISSYVVTDKDFPFTKKDELMASIIDGKLVIQKADSIKL